MSPAKPPAVEPTRSPVPEASAAANLAEALAAERTCREAVQKRQPVKGWEESGRRISELAGRMERDFVDRSAAVHGILASLISRTGCVLLGPPGTAKSLLVTRIADECDLRRGTADANYFEYLLTAHTMPEEIFGPTDIGLLLKDPPEVHRRTDARLPHAELAFLDEVFRGGSHILNTLLTILNERKFHNGRAVEEVPLVGFIGAANFPPQTEDLRAFFDRFPVRIWVDSVLKSESNREANGLRLIEADAGLRAGSRGSGPRPSMLDFRKLWATLRIKLSTVEDASSRGREADRLREFTRNFAAFRGLGRLSDRSFVQLWYFAGALDLVRGADCWASWAAGGKGHFECFEYVAPDEISYGKVRHELKSLMARQSASGA